MSRFTKITLFGLLVTAASMAALVVLAVLEGLYALIPVGLMASVSVAMTAMARTDAMNHRREIDDALRKLDRIQKQVKEAANRTDDSASYLRTSAEELQIAETAARFDWLARRHREQAEVLERFMTDVRALLGEHVGRSTSVAEDSEHSNS